MQYQSGLETVDLIPKLGIDEEMDDVLPQGLYIGIIDDFHDYKERMENLIQRHSKDACKLEKMLVNETDEEIRTDYEIDIRRAKNYAERNEMRLKIATENRGTLIFFVRQDGLPGFEPVDSTYKKLFDAERREFLVYNYA